MTRKEVWTAVSVVLVLALHVSFSHIVLIQALESSSGENEQRTQLGRLALFCVPGDCELIDDHNSDSENVGSDSRDVVFTFWNYRSERIALSSSSVEWFSYVQLKRTDLFQAVWPLCLLLLFLAIAIIVIRACLMRRKTMPD